MDHKECLGESTQQHLEGSRGGVWDEDGEYPQVMESITTTVHEREATECRRQSNVQK